LDFEELATTAEGEATRFPARTPISCAGTIFLRGLRSDDVERGWTSGLAVSFRVGVLRGAGRRPLCSPASSSAISSGCSTALRPRRSSSCPGSGGNSRFGVLRPGTFLWQWRTETRERFRVQINPLCHPALRRVGTGATPLRPDETRGEIVVFQFGGRLMIPQVGCDVVPTSGCACSFM